MNDRIIEMVSFRLKAGTSEAEFLKTVPATSTFVAALNGFISRRLSCDTQGNWLEHIEWETLAKAEAASKAFMAEEKLMPMMSSIDMSSIRQSHNRLLVSID